MDADPVVRPDAVSGSIDALRAAVPEDIASGLTWGSEKRFYFVLTVFCARQADAQATPDSDSAIQSEGGEEPAYGPDAQTLGDLHRTYPHSRDKEAVALILARNSVVAAWLWRRYAQDTRLAGNEIRIDPWFPVWP